MQDLGHGAGLQLKANHQQPTVCNPRSPAHARSSSIVLWHGAACLHRGPICVQRGSSMSVMADRCLIDAASAVEPGQAGLTPRIHERNSGSPALPKA